VRLQYIFLCVLLLGIFSLPAGCGKKAPPSLPKTKKQFSQTRGPESATPHRDRESITNRRTLLPGDMNVGNCRTNVSVVKRTRGPETNC